LKCDTEQRNFKEEAIQIFGGGDEAMERTRQFDHPTDGLDKSKKVPTTFSKQAL
jgi:hypothetical protein